MQLHSCSSSSTCETLRHIDSVRLPINSLPPGKKNNIGTLNNLLHLLIHVKKGNLFQKED